MAECESGTSVLSSGARGRTPPAPRCQIHGAELRRRRDSGNRQAHSPKSARPFPSSLKKQSHRPCTDFSTEYCRYHGGPKLLLDVLRELQSAEFTHCWYPNIMEQDKHWSLDPYVNHRKGYDDRLFFYRQGQDTHDLLRFSCREHDLRVDWRRLENVLAHLIPLCEPKRCELGDPSKASLLSSAANVHSDTRHIQSTLPLLSIPRHGCAHAQPVHGQSRGAMYSSRSLLCSLGPAHTHNPAIFVAKHSEGNATGSLPLM